MAYEISGECVACGACEPECPVEAINEGALKYDIDPDKCTDCGTCANVCPTKAINMVDHDGIRTISIREEIIGQNPLERCEGCGRLYATSKFLSHIEQRTLPVHPEVKDHHHYCPTCAKLFSDRVRRLE